MAAGHYVEVGRLAYREAWELQRSLVTLRASGSIPDTLMLVEHDPVITHGSAFKDANLLLPPEGYSAKGIELVQTDRGGDVTYHGPKQLVIYPIFDVRQHGGDLHKWLRDLEETMIATAAAFGLDGYRFPPNTGVWVNDKKIAAIGIKVSRWVNLHGIALNCDNDLSPFKLIVPCGISEYGVTSLSIETGRAVGIADAAPVVVSSFEKVFGMQLTRTSLGDDAKAT